MVFQGVQPQNNQNGNQPSNANTGNTNTGATLNETSEDMVKAPANSLPKQCSTNMAKQSTEEEQADTFIGMLSRIFTVKTPRWNLHCCWKFRRVEIHLCIVDSGADSHVGGLQGWLPLVDLNGPCITHVNVVGYCHETTKKNGLPVGDMVTKAITRDGKVKFLRARHITVNDNLNMHC